MIYVFKTTVQTKVQARKLKPHLDQILPTAKWNFDLHDCDKILRVDSEDNIIHPIVSLLKRHNFRCEELE